MPSSFIRFAERKTLAASAATILPLKTVADRSRAFSGRDVGNEWTHTLYAGNFHLCDLPAMLPAASLVFVQSRDGDTIADDPADFGGGATDQHLLYEGLSRVAVDAVMAGAASAAGEETFFSVWHPQLVALRRTLGLPRHPAQVVVSRNGRINIDAMLFNVPNVPVYLLAGTVCRRRWESELKDRPWVTVVPFDAEGLPNAMASLRQEYQLTRISVIGGPSLASALIDAGLIHDLCLTTTSLTAGRPQSPFYSGSRILRWETIVKKIGVGDSSTIVFEHLMLESF